MDIFTINECNILNNIYFSYIPYKYVTNYQRFGPT